MRIKSLLELCNPKQHKTISTSDFLDEGFPLYGANGKIGFTSSYTHDRPTLAITCRGATCGSLHISDPKSYINGNAMALNDLKEELVDIKYLYYYLGVRGFKDIISGSAQPQITRLGLKKLQIPLPDLPTQRKIAAALDKADAIRRRNQQMLKKYDQLAQSVFLEMFGDLAINPKNWTKVNLIQTVSDNGDIKCGPFGSQLHSSEFVSSGIPLWGIKQVNKGFVKQTSDFITIEKYRDLKVYNILPDDIIMTRKGTIGNSAVYPKDLPEGIMHSDLLRIRVNKSITNPIFLSYQFKESRDIYFQIKSISSGAIMAGINVTKLKKIGVIIPPIDLQNKFAKAIEKIELQKQKLQQETLKSAELFQSLLQRAFKGELFEEEVVEV